jgi:glycosyltransferase involved in cell wall biosynthesis
MMRTTRVVTVASRWLQEKVCEVRGNASGVFYLPNCGASAANSRIQEKIRFQSQVEIKRELGLPEGPVIFYSGHFDLAENAMFFCQSASPVAERNNATIVFVGDGPELAHVKKFFSERQNSRVTFFPRLPYDQFVRAVWASDVAAFPYPDNAAHRAKCSVRIIDYMAMGKPVITSAVGQNMEYIVDGESGVLAPPGDESAFARKLEELLCNSDLRVRLGQAAEKRVRENFNWSGDALQQCLAAYRHLTAA